MTVVGVEGVRRGRAEGRRAARGARPARRRRRPAVGAEAEGPGRPGVQAMLDVFGTEIKDVEEM